MKLSFYGGARTVTGANYLLETNQARILIDCGLFQGVKHAEERNYEAFSYDPAQIDAVLVTHAHLDHVGRIPKLYKDGFSGPVYSTPPTRDLMELMLQDSVGIIAQEARRDHHDPLYTKEDIQHCIDGLCTDQPYDEWFPVASGIEVQFRNVAHILGSARVDLRVEEGDTRMTLTFTGDVGSDPNLLLPPKDPLDPADILVVESVYAGREHEDRARRQEKLRTVIATVMENRGVLMIPSFAIERTQELLYDLNALIEDEGLKRCPVFLDSPLAIKATRVFRRYPSYFTQEAQERITGGDKIFDFPGLIMTETSDESRAINDVAPPKIIIAGSGMSTGGRILHHEKRYLSGKNNVILFVGYQAAGTLGRRILDGDNRVRILGDDIPVHCRVEAIGAYSGHADQTEILRWLAPVADSVRRVFVVQGEEAPALELTAAVTEQFNIPATAPMTGDVVELT